MKRRLFTILSSLSLLFVVAMSLASYSSEQLILFRHRTERGGWRVGCEQRHWVVAVVRGPTLVSSVSPFGAGTQPATLGVDLMFQSRHWKGRWYGLTYFELTLRPPLFDRTTSIHFYGIASWLLIALLTTVVMLVGARIRRSRLRAQRGQCPSCGYDLRATPGGARNAGSSPPLCRRPRRRCGGMTNDQGPMTKEVPMTNDQ